ncbi:hypothetical protein [Larkinella sp.]|uniref:hypothetical protein n=1 Tax=Larkinella sp. TaxID=2034517 RepID=UPI003BA8FC0A
MIIKATVFEVRDSSRAMKRPASLNVRASLMAEVMRKVAAYVLINEKPVVASGPSGTGLEVGTAFMALHRDDYKQVLTLLLELAGGDKENAMYRQIRAIMERE